MKPTQSTQWQYLKTDGAWLFSTGENESLQISCPGEIYKNINLQGVGILRLAEGCIGRTPHMMLISNSIRVSKSQYVYDLDFALNITDILPKLRNHDNSSDNDPGLLTQEALSVTVLG